MRKTNTKSGGLGAWARAVILALAACLLPVSRSSGYVTSATLEFVGDDKCGFYLNGRQLLGYDQCELLYFWWNCLSTSDGTLPLELFNCNSDNLLAAANYDIFGGGMWMAYRLTVHHSNGDPVVIWGEPGGSTKFLNVPKEKPLPPGWFDIKFDDSPWGTPKAMQAINAETGGNLYRLEDAHFRGFLGTRGYVPFLSHSTDGHTRPQDTDIYRNHFRFPNAIGKASLLMNPASALAGQSVAFRLIPSKDAADFSSFQVSINLPQGLQPGQIGGGGQWDAANRKISWALNRGPEAVKYVTLYANSILSASAWKNPEKALGPYKPDLRRYVQSIPDAVLNEGAWFDPGMPAWFKLTQSEYSDTPGAPMVLGVIFRGQVQVGGTERGSRHGASQIFLNYSVDGTSNGFLKNDVQFSHSATHGGWTDGYYDASEDRKWTWNDINRVQAKLVSRQFAERAQGQVASLRLIVRAFQPSTVSPYFFASVADRQCKTLQIGTQVKDTRSGMTAIDNYPLPINQGACPTPTTRPTPAAVASKLPPPPTPVPAPTANIVPGCLESSPEPFKHGGVFVYFCLKEPAQITLNVFDQKGTLLRTMPAGLFRAGNNQIFYNGIDNNGQTLSPGSYMYEIKSVSQDTNQSRNNHFTRAGD